MELQTENDKDRNTKLISTEDLVCIVDREGRQSWDRRESISWEGFVKRVGFKPGVKERRSGRWWEWWIDRKTRHDVGRGQWDKRKTGLRLTQIITWFQRHS